MQNNKSVVNKRQVLLKNKNVKINNSLSRNSLVQVQKSEVSCSDDES